MDETDSSLSTQAKEYLVRKLEELQKKVVKLKRKRKMIKILYYSSITLSISLTGVMTTLSSFSSLPIIVIPILSTSTGILTGLSAKFNLQNKNIEINKAIEKIHKIQEKLDYVISCNGNFTKDDLQQIISEITIL
jgi:hypothetical protein